MRLAHETAHDISERVVETRRENVEPAVVVVVPGPAREADLRPVNSHRLGDVAERAVAIRDRLAYLAKCWPVRVDVLFRLGESWPVAASKRHSPPGRRFRRARHFPVRPPSPGRQTLPATRFSDAERISREALEKPSSSTGEVRHLLLVILGQQGRLDEARRLIEATFSETGRSQSERLALLREHLALDLETIPLDGILKLLGSAAPPDPMTKGSGWP